MKRIVVVCTLLGFALSPSMANAGWGHLSYSGYQPWWNIFAKRYKCLTPEEERLQKFWHDYYDAMKNFYKALDCIDWVAYYKNHGYQISPCGPHGGCGRVNYAPVFVSPTIQWAVPQGCAGGPPVGPPYGFGHGHPGHPGHPGHGPGPFHAGMNPYGPYGPHGPYGGAFPGTAPPNNGTPVNTPAPKDGPMGPMGMGPMGMGPMGMATTAPTPGN